MRPSATAAVIMLMMALSFERSATAMSLDNAINSCTLGNDRVGSVALGLDWKKQPIVSGHGRVDVEKIPSLIGSSVGEDASKIALYDKIQTCIDNRLHEDRPPVPERKITSEWVNGPRKRSTADGNAAGAWETACIEADVANGFRLVRGSGRLEYEGDPDSIPERIGVVDRGAPTETDYSFCQPFRSMSRDGGHAHAINAWVRAIQIKAQ